MIFFNELVKVLTQFHSIRLNKTTGFSKDVFEFLRRKEDLKYPAKIVSLVNLAFILNSTS